MSSEWRMGSRPLAIRYSPFAIPRPKGAPEDRIVAELVGAFGVPHTPVFPWFVKRDGPQCETAQLFRSLTENLEALRPDLIVMFDTDHLNTFFLDNLPIFAVGVTERFKGPERRAARGAGLHHQVAAGLRRPCSPPRSRCRFRPGAGAGVHRRPLGRGAVALHDAADADPRGADLHQWSCAAAALGAALLRARARGQARDRELAAAVAGRHHGQRQLLARRLGAAHRTRPLRRRARPRLGETRVRVPGAGEGRRR